MQNLQNKNVLIIAADGFQREEFFRPLEELREQGATVKVASMKREPIFADSEDQRSYTPELTFDETRAEDFDALVIPGGVKNPDTLRTQKRAVELVRDFASQGKPIAAICHGPWLLVEADVLKDRQATSYPSIRTDLENAGAKWTDSEVVVDNGIVTSRKPSDIDAFNAKLIEEIREGKHARTLKAA